MKTVKILLVVIVVLVLFNGFLIYESLKVNENYRNPLRECKFNLEKAKVLADGERTQLANTIREMNTELVNLRTSQHRFDLECEKNNETKKSNGHTRP